MWKFHADWSNSRLPALMTDVIAQWTKESNRKAVNRWRMMEKTGRGIIVKIRLVLFIRRNLWNFHILYHPNFSNNPPFFFSSFFSFSSRGEKRVLAILLPNTLTPRVSSLDENRYMHISKHILLWIVLSNNRGAQAFRHSDIRKGDGSLAKVRYETSRPNYIDSNPSACLRRYIQARFVARVTCRLRDAIRKGRKKRLHRAKRKTCWKNCNKIRESTSADINLFRVMILHVSAKCVRTQDSENGEHFESLFKYKRAEQFLSELKSSSYS